MTLPYDVIHEHLAHLDVWALVPPTSTAAMTDDQRKQHSAAVLAVTMQALLTVAVLSGRLPHQVAAEIVDNLPDEDEWEGQLLPMLMQNAEQADASAAAANRGGDNGREGWEATGGEDREEDEVRGAPTD